MRTLDFRRATHRLVINTFTALGIAMGCGPSIALAASKPPMYTLVELSNISGNTAGSIALAISDPTVAGPVVVGQSFSAFTSPTLSWRAVVWRPDVSLAPIDLLTPAQAGNSSVNRAQDVSQSGTYIVGYSNVNPPRGKRWKFDPATGTVTAIETLSVLPGDLAGEAVGVNSAGRAVGYSLTDASTIRGVMWGTDETVPLLLPTPAGSGGIRLAREVSEEPLAHIVGRCDMSSTPTTRPIIWKKNTLGNGAEYGMGELLQLLSPNAVHDAVGIAPNGLLAVGLGANATQARGVGWDTSTNAVIDLGGLCCSNNVVYDINNDGVGVGYIGLSFDVFRAVLYWGGEAYDLNERIVNMPDIGNELFLHVATGINSAGQIVGKFGGFASGEPLSPGRVFVLTPVPVQIPGDVTGDGKVNANDLLAVINAWGPCAQPCPPTCAADVTDDCTVNANDLLLVINNWGKN